MQIGANLPTRLFSRTCLNSHVTDRQCLISSIASLSSSSLLHVLQHGQDECLPLCGRLKRFRLACARYFACPESCQNNQKSTLLVMFPVDCSSSLFFFCIQGHAPATKRHHVIHEKTSWSVPTHSPACCPPPPIGGSARTPAHAQIWGRAAGIRCARPAFLAPRLTARGTAGTPTLLCDSCPATPPF